MTAPPKQFPKDGLVIISMMKDLGITNFEPRVVNQLMEFAIRYVSCVLEDARAYANHAKKKSIDNDDVKLAVTMQLEKVFTTPPPRDLLLEVAMSKNSATLPLVKSHCGLRLPPDRYCFSSCNYKLKYSKRSDITKGKFTLGGNSGLNSALKVAKNAGMSMKRPNIGVARSQTLTSMSKPVMKITTSPMVVGQKAKVQMQTQNMEIKVEPDSNGGLKRKREEEDNEIQQMQ